MQTSIKLVVNGQERTVTTDPQRPLLEVLREDLGLTGTKYGCGEGQCGACTVIVDGLPTRSCNTDVGKVAGKSITTIEALSADNSLHPLQEAFLEEGALQCGYCTSGMIMEASVLLEKHPQPTEEQVVEEMNGHICRCNGYTKILRAIHRAAENMKG